MTSQHTTQTFDALVAFVISLRPSWQTPGIRAAIRDALARQPAPTLAELAYAIVALATNPTIVSPAVLPMDGAHWRLTRLEQTPTPLGKCDRCRGFHDGAPCPGPPGDQRAGVTAVRLALAKARADVAAAREARL